MEHLMKSYLAIMAERDAAINERNMAVVEKKKALADRDMAILQRDAAIAELNDRILKIDGSPRYHYSPITGDNLNGSRTPPGKANGHQHLNADGGPHLAEASYGPKMVLFDEIFSKSGAASNSNGSEKVGQPNNSTLASSKKNASRKDQKRCAPKTGHENGATAGPVPVCSCTGVPRQCYKVGDGGWQSACCTTDLSMYPLPLTSDKHRRKGRKMTPSAYRKLFGRLVAEGHDRSVAVDLKDHWAKLGTNRYITIK